MGWRMWLDKLDFQTWFGMSHEIMLTWFCMKKTDGNWSKVCAAMKLHGCCFCIEEEALQKLSKSASLVLYVFAKILSKA